MEFWIITLIIFAIIICLFAVFYIVRDMIYDYKYYKRKKKAKENLEASTRNEGFNDEGEIATTNDLQDEDTQCDEIIDKGSDAKDETATANGLQSNEVADVEKE